MKRFAIVCALVLLLNVLCPVGHVHAEEISTPTDLECEHYRYCDGGNTCGACGVEYTGDSVQHNGTLEWVYDETNHWQQCSECYPATGEKLNEGAHDSLAACSVCGYACVHENMDWEYDETQHWKQCTLCDYRENAYTHRTDCKNKGVCVDCGATFAYNEDDVIHSTGSNVEYVWDEKQHYNVCIDCGQSIWGEAHSSIETPGICAYCGASFADCANGVHINLSSWMSDETMHWQKCLDCEAAVGTEAHYSDGTPGECTVCGAYVAPACDHWRYCNDENTCGACGGEYTGENIQHLAKALQMDADSHWYYCGACEMNYDQVFHNYDVADYNYDTQWHWFDCNTCGVESGRAMHTVTCENASLCIECGYDQCDVGSGHNVDYTTWQHDETHHWRKCTRCDYRETVWQHVTSCAKQGVCVDCGTTFDYDEDEIRHTIMAGGEYTWDQYQHYDKCLDCGQAVYGDVHNSDCSDPDKCLFCGADGITVAYIDHWNAEADWSYDDQYHWYYCSDCQGKAWAEPHSRQHGDPEVCNVCGAPYSGDEGHVQDSSVPHNETTHESKCADCGEIYKNLSLRGVLKAPTCTEDGLESNMCGLCWSEVKVPIPATGHNVTEWNEEDDRRHQGTCENCGETVVGYHSRSKTIGYYDNDYCLYACGKCGAEFKGEHLYVTSEDGWFYDETYHYYMCGGCGEKVNKSEHGGASCGFPYCQTCGTAYTTDPSVVAHTISCSSTDGKCERCGKSAGDGAITNHTWGDPVTVAATCTTDGSVTTTCTVCGEKTVVTISGGHSFVYHYDNEGFHWEYCTKCQLMQNYEQHPIPEKSERYSNETECWNICPLCNAEWGRIGHVQDCMGEFCIVCEAPFVGEYVSHFIDMEDGPFVYVNEKVHELECLNCGKSAGFPDAHTIDESKTVTVEATCTKDGSITKVCTKCNGKIVETIPATGNHTWETVSKVYATCTKAGRTERVCTVCGELSITTSAAKGHAYGLVFITEGNGTHAKTCADCGAKLVEDCVLNSTEMGNMVCSACATCGYAVYTMTDSVLEEVEELTEAKAEIEVRRVENVSFEIVAEPAEEGAESETEAEAEPSETADVVLVVHETQLEMTVELPEVVNANVKKVLAVSMLQEGNAIQPSSKVKLSIPVVEEEVAGMKLVLMGENGELVEIEYEIIDGVLVFETELVGIFLFVEAEA